MTRVAFYEESTGWGGTERYLFDLASRLALLGIDIELIVRLLHPAEEVSFVRRFDGAGVGVTWIRGEVASVPSEIKRLVSAFRHCKETDRVVHFNQQTPASMSTAILAARLAGCATRVATNHLPTLGTPTHNLIGNSLYRMARRSLTLSIFESRQNFELAVQNGVARRAASRTVLHGVDTSLFRPSDGSSTRRDLDLPLDAFVIGTIGRLEPQKAHHVLVRSIARMATLQPELNPQLVVVGDGSQRGPLEDLVDSMDLRSRVHLLGHVEPAATLYPAFDVFALASAWEGLPLSLLEAMSSGLAVLATDVGGVGDAIVDGTNGLLVPPGVEADLVKGLLALTDVGRRRELGSNARADAVRRFSVGRMVEETLTVYQEALAKSGRGTRR
jgi:glycosyltransferase involved in cell wall biosynthesis